jgi:hypothetical protein
MLKRGDRVRHRRFGTGAVHEVHPDQRTPTALVKWDTHRVTKPWRDYTVAYSWVYVRSLAAETGGGRGRRG